MARVTRGQTNEGLVAPTLPTQVFGHEIIAAFHFLFRQYQQSSYAMEFSQ